MIKKGGAAGLLLVIVLVLSCLASGCAKGSGQSGQSGKKEVRKTEAATEAVDALDVDIEYVNGFLQEEKESGRIDELADEYIYQNIEEKDKAA